MIDNCASGIAHPERFELPFQAINLGIGNS
jgi:hypothetical protein